MEAKEYNFTIGRWFGGFELLPYQIALGISGRRWSTGPALRLYFGPFKLWLTRHNKGIPTELRKYANQEWKCPNCGASMEGE